MFGSSQRSNVWVFHTEAGLWSTLDGYGVRKVFFAELGNSRVYESRVGQLWSVSAQGIQEFQNGSWTRFPLKEIREQPEALRQNGIPLLPLKQGHVLFLLPDRLMEFSDDRQEAVVVRHVRQTKLEKFSDIIIASDGTVWISGKLGLARVSADAANNPEAPWQEFVLPPELQVESLGKIFVDDAGGVTTTGVRTIDGRKVIVHFDGKEWITPRVRDEIRQAWRGVDGTFWFLATNALFRVERRGQEWIEIEEQPALAGQYFDVLAEGNGVFWLATSEGLFRSTPLTWRRPMGQFFSGAIHAALLDRDERLWFAEDDGLLLFEQDRWEKFFYPEKFHADLQPSALYHLPNGSIALAMRDRLIEFEPARRAFSSLSHPSGLALRALGQLKDGGLCVQALAANGAGGAIRLDVCDGATCKPFVEVPAELNLGNELSVAMAAQNGAIWIGGVGGVAFFQNQKWQSFNPSESTMPGSAVCLMESGEGKIWCGVRDQIWQFDGKNWSILRSVLERVNSFFKSRDGNIWVASNGGIHRFHRGDWVGNGIEEGLSSLVVRQLVEDRQGHLWAATSRGLSLYHPEADMDMPQTFIERPKAQSVSVEGEVRFVFGGSDKWKYTSPDRLLFSYRLDEQEWSPFQSDRTVLFPELAGGKHFFQARAMDRNWNVDSKPALLEFSVPVPWYQETRLVLIAGAGAVGVLFFAAVAFNRHRRLVRSYAEVERIVQVRTRQLEKANQQLFQSQKMNALGTLAAGIAHDFNSILSIIKGSAQIIEGNLEDHEKIQTRVERIKTAVDQGAGIVKAMLGFSRVSDKQVVVCEINSVVEETIKLLGDRFQRDVQVKFEPTKALPLLRVSKDFIQQILLNFILNASEAMSGPGQIVLRSGMMNRPPAEIVLTPVEAINYVFIAVEDFGCGIAPEIMPRIFEPFFTTKSFSTKRGTGLGLSMVYELAKEMGAGLSVESESGKGSTFTLILPVKSDA